MDATISAIAATGKLNWEASNGQNEKRTGKKACGTKTKCKTLK